MIAHERHLLNEPLNTVESKKSYVRWQNKYLNVVARKETRDYD